MYNTKLLLKEELMLNDRKNLLSEHSISLINNQAYVNHVLGIDCVLNEHNSLSLRRAIINEQLIAEAMLDSINKYIGIAYEKGKEKTLEVVDSIKNLKDIAKLVKDLMLDPDLMRTALNHLQRSLVDTMKRITDSVTKILTTIKFNIEGFTDKFSKLIEHISNVSEKLLSESGWTGFLIILSFTTLLAYLEKTYIDGMLTKGLDFITKNAGMVSMIANIFDKFKELKGLVLSAVDIKPILSWFSSVGVGAAAGATVGAAFAAVDIINLMGKILAPVIKSIDWGKKLQKKPQV